MPNLNKLGIVLFYLLAGFLRNDLIYSRVNVLCHGHFKYRDQMLVCEVGSMGCLGQLHYKEHLLTGVGASEYRHDAWIVKAKLWL